MIDRLLREPLDDWFLLVAHYETDNKKLPVPFDNSIENLYVFNSKLNELYTNCYYDYARAKRNKDAIERLIENVLKDYYTGKNDAIRRAAGIQYAQAFPLVDGETINLFALEDAFNGIFYSLDATIQVLKAKAESKITNNSLIKLEKSLI